MSEAETFHDVVDSEVHFREDEPRVETSTPPTTITSNDLDVIIEGWELKFEHLSRCMREIQLASEKASTEMHNMTRDGRARKSLQERRIEEIHVGLTEFLERCDPAHLAASRPFDAPAASTSFTPSTPTGVPSRLRPDYVQTSISNHLLSTRTSQQNPRAARIRASEITTTLGTRAPGITTTLGTRASEITTTLGTCASEITTTLGICATTTIIALEIGAGITDPMTGLHTRTTEGIAATCSATHTIVG